MYISNTSFKWPANQLINCRINDAKWDVLWAQHNAPNHINLKNILSLRPATGT